jgi:cyclopropane fatty-acyl-phospholipid synthase-like methyltransferase
MNFLRKILFTYWYFRKPPWDTNQTPPEVLEFILNNPPGRALDLGCGTGTNAITLAENDWRVVGVDFVGKAIHTAKRKAQAAGVAADFHIGDVTKLDGIEGSFDLILDIGCYHNLSPQGMAKYRENVYRLLGAQGKFMLYAFFREAAESGPGVVEADLAAFSPPLTLISRTDSFERGSLPAVWLTFQKTATEVAG